VNLGLDGETLFRLVWSGECSWYTVAPYMPIICIINVDHEGISAFSVWTQRCQLSHFAEIRFRSAIIPG
jgi:hypothetical protein